MSLHVIALLAAAALAVSAPDLYRYDQSAVEPASAPEQIQKPEPAAPNQAPQKPAEKSTLLPPSIVFGDTARIDFRVEAPRRLAGRLCRDLRRLDQFDLRRARLGVEEGDIKNNLIE